MLSPVAGSVWREKVRVTELNSSTLNRSRGVSAASAWMTAAFACAIESPVMEPEVSMTRIISRGTRSIAAISPAVGCGGITITSATATNPAPLFRDPKPCLTCTPQSHVWTGRDDRQSALTSNVTAVTVDRTGET